MDMDEMIFVIGLVGTTIAVITIMALLYKNTGAPLALFGAGFFSALAGQGLYVVSLCDFGGIGFGGIGFLISMMLLIVPGIVMMILAKRRGYGVGPRAE